MSLGSSDFRKTLPRFSDDYKENNQQLASAFAECCLTKKLYTGTIGFSMGIGAGRRYYTLFPVPKKQNTCVKMRLLLILNYPGDLQDIQNIMDKYPNTGMRYGEGAFKLVNN